MPLKYACIFVFKKSGFLKVNAIIVSLALTGYFLGIIRYGPMGPCH